MTQSAIITVSVIIPTLNEAGNLAAALASIGIIEEGVECLVVDGGSRDNTCTIARSWPGVTLIQADQSGRGYQMNLGVASASGDILLFLHADCLLPIDAIKYIQKHCESDKISGGSFCLSFAREHWVLQLCSAGSRINHPLTTYGDQAQFMRRDVFKKIDGFKEWPLMEDLEIQYRLRRHGKLIKIPEPVISSDRRYRRRGPFLHQLLNVVLVVLYLVGVSPERLANWYRPGEKKS